MVFRLQGCQQDIPRQVKDDIPSVQNSRTEGKRDNKKIYSLISMTLWMLSRIKSKTVQERRYLLINMDDASCHNCYVDSYMSERMLADGLWWVSTRRLREASLLVLGEELYWNVNRLFYRVRSHLGEELRRRLLLNFLPRPLIILHVQPD